MAANTSRNKQTLRSTDRGGVVSLTAGILCLALGFGMLIGISLQSSSYSVLSLKNLALGLGGVLYPLVPIFAIWLGWLLCVSARHYISFRTFALSFSIFLLLGAFLILVTSIPGFGTLMDYIHNMNANINQLPEPGSFGAYLSRAYAQYDKKLTPLQGGGALGMMVAFPVWRFLGQVGGLIFLVLGLIALGFALLRISPVRLAQKLDARIQRGPQQPATEPQPAPQPATQGEPQPAPAYQMQNTPYYVDPAPEADMEPAVPQWQPAGPVETVEVDPQWQPPQPEVLPWQTAPAAQAEPGFVPVSQDFVETFDPAPAPPGPIVRRQRRAVQTPQVAAEPAPLAPEKQEELAPPPVASQPVPQTAAIEQASVKPEAPVVEAIDEPFEEPFEEPQEEPVVEPARPAQRASQKPQVVGVQPAVPLTGQRVAVNPRASLDKGQSGMDGMAKPKAPQQQMIPIDDYQYPPARLLTSPPPDAKLDTTEEDVARAEKLISTLDSFSIPAEVQQIVHGPAITRFAIRLGEGVNVNKLRNVMDNISVELLAKAPVRAEIPIPGTPLIGIEVSNDKTTPVYLQEVLESPKMKEIKSPTAVALGKDITGAPVVCELMDMPHLLIAGATGSGKSVCINSIITSLLYRATPREVRMILVDPKFVELQMYNDMPHLLMPVVVDPKKAVAALEWVCIEMDERYQRLQKLRARNIDAYNRRIGPDEEPMPRIIVIVDEMSDLMVSAGKVIDEHVKRITAKARAAGICLILATQRPSVDVITGIIKANVPSRIAFQVTSQVDSRTILDSQGAEKLLGYGDMLYLPRNLPAPKRVQGCYVKDEDVARVMDFIKSRHQANYDLDMMEHVEKSDQQDGSGAVGGAGSADEVDELLPKAIEMAVEAGQMSISMLQRVLRVGYGRAGRLIDEMERRGVVSGNEGTKPRKTLITREQYLELFGDELGAD